MEIIIWPKLLGAVLWKGRAKIMESKIAKTLIMLIIKWMNNKKTGSLQINFIKGEINSAFINLPISLENNDNRV